MNNKPIYILGHKKPDTDSICSAIAYTYLKNKVEGTDKYQAGRIGNINKETEYVLSFLEVEKPQLVEDVKSRVIDMLTNRPITISPETTIKEINDIRKTKQIKSLPVVDNEFKLQGLVTMGDLAAKVMTDLERDFLGPTKLELDCLSKILNGRVIVKNHDTNLSGKVLVGAMSQKTLSKYISKNDIVILGDRPKAQLDCIKAGAKCLILTCNTEPNEEIISKASQNDSAIITVPFDSFKTARFLIMATPVKSFLKSEDIIHFYDDDLIEEAKKEMLSTRFRSYPVIDHDHKLIGMVSRKDLLTLKGKEVILVDHNEKSQAVTGIDEAKIKEIIDHHRLGDLSSNEPILIRNEPVGSTATIVYQLYKEYCISPPKHIAGLMLAAILSDTVMLKSPTCTNLDKQFAHELEKISELNIQEFGKRMFQEGAGILKENPNSMITKDFKEFSFGEKKVAIGQMNAVDKDDVLAFITNIRKAMTSLVNENDYHLLLFMITDIQKQDSLILAEGPEKASLEAVFQKPLDLDSLYLENVVSRKKQVVPPLSEYFSNQ
ncbi:putative manganese-dependent inorganic diphosphatase [Natranaerobius trueperi]|uniref:inorganic diphosphatase n=1 Tax=Natranaerobius trueperi TaxID=759412 RepID=A0A226BZQ2_9FIRM|nr:putative manganese-dependent inorganic diphosphatase [Natranaerobius trueperi]OWZ83577.1 manganese-dependent inorganic pyrophosphatase [Natranaerobius trueperi]